MTLAIANMYLMLHPMGKLFSTLKELLYDNKILEIMSKYLNIYKRWQNLTGYLKVISLEKFHFLDTMYIYILYTYIVY